MTDEDTIRILRADVVRLTRANELLQARLDELRKFGSRVWPIQDSICSTQIVDERLFDFEKEFGPRLRGTAPNP